VLKALQLLGLRGFKIEVEYDADWTQESEGSRSSVEMTISLFFSHIFTLTGAEISHPQLVKPSAILGQDFGGSYFPGVLRLAAQFKGPCFVVPVTSALLHPVLD